MPDRSKALHRRWPGLDNAARISSMIAALIGLNQSAGPDRFHNPLDEFLSVTGLNEKIRSTRSGHNPCGPFGATQGKFTKTRYLNAGR